MCSAKQRSITLLSDEELMAAMVSQLEKSTATATACLDTALAHLADARAHRAERCAKARAQARAEFADIDPEAFAELAVAESRPKAK